MKFRIIKKSDNYFTVQTKHWLGFWYIFSNYSTLESAEDDINDFIKIHNKGIIVKEISS